jgi:hypothetical protein
MRSFMKMTIAVACLAGGGLAATDASAQYYYDQYGRQIYSQPQVYSPYGYQQPRYVPPRVARRQAIQRERFNQRYGYGQGYPHGYGQPGAQHWQYRQPGNFHNRPQPHPYGMSTPGGG